jgi:hypothetical protein
MNSLLLSRILAALVAVLLVLSLIPTSGGPLLETIITGAGLGKVDDAANNYLAEQREQALKGFLVISALKVGLAVLKSSEVGFILNVKIGDLAVAVYDYVDFAWKVLLAAVAFYYIAGYLLDLVSVVNIWFLWAALASLLLWLLVRMMRPESAGLRTAAARMTVAGSMMAVLLYIGIPLSLLGAGWVSIHITGEPINRANSLYEDMRQNMPPLLEERSSLNAGSGSSRILTSSITVPVPYDGTDTSVSVTTGPEVTSRSGGLASLVSGEKLRELRKFLQERSRTLASAVLRQTAAYLFNIVVFPLLTLVLVYSGIKYLWSLVLDLQRL